MLATHVFIWTLAAWLSRGNLDVPGDMVENYIWGIEWQPGYAKHPPLFAWITAAWFMVFPRVDIAYFALSALNAMLGLLGIAALARRFLPHHLALIAGLAMAVSPLYSTLAIKFNANAVLLSLWPWTAYFFVRFMQGGGWRSAVLLGALAGATVLGKYFSVVLLAALLLAALARPVWRARLLRPASLWIVMSGTIVLLPHLHWLISEDFPTLAYAQHRSGGTRTAATRRLGMYALAQFAYLLPSSVVLLGLVRQHRCKALGAMLQASVKPSRCPDVWWLAFGPMIVVAGLALVTKTEMASVWGMAQWFAIVPLWLWALEDRGVALVAKRVLPMMLMYWTCVLAVSALVGYGGALRGTEGAIAPRIELAEAAHRVWRQQTGHAMPIVAGSIQEAGSIAFYAAGTTRYWNPVRPLETPWLALSDLYANGALFVCRREDGACIERAGELSGVLPLTLTVAKQGWGRTLPGRSFFLFVMPPSR